jgi:hypothetical protein
VGIHCIFTDKSTKFRLSTHLRNKGLAGIANAHSVSLKVESIHRNYMSYADQRHIRPSPTLSGSTGVRKNPLDVFKRICVAEGYEHDQVDINELQISLPGLWCQHDVSLTWNAATEQVQVFLLFEGRMPGGRSDDICRLMSLLNERLASGHFDYWDKNRCLVYRDATSLRGGAQLGTEQGLDMLAHALDAAERGYPACQYVIWAGKSPEDALTSALVDLAAQP